MDPVSDSALQPALWPLEPLPPLRRTTTDLAMDTTGRDTTHPDLMLIMAGQSITALGTIAGEHLLTGKEKGPVHPGLFLSLKMRGALSAATVRKRCEVGLDQRPVKHARWIAL